MQRCVGVGVGMEANKIRNPVIPVAFSTLLPTRGVKRPQRVPTDCLVVRNLPPERNTVTELSNHFQQFGTIINIRVSAFSSRVTSGSVLCAHECSTHARTHAHTHTHTTHTHTHTRLLILDVEN